MSLGALLSLGFSLLALGTGLLIGEAEENAERIGELTGYGLIAVPVGILWLSKGWKLIVLGITAVPAETTSVPAERKRAAWLYISLFAGMILLTVWLGILAFSAFSSSVLPFHTNPTSKPPNSLSVAVFLMLVAWWPYSSWKGILLREPNSDPRNLGRHKLTTVVLGGFCAIVWCVTVIFGIQNGNDRLMSYRIEAETASFQDVAAKIGSIKSRNLETTEDYVKAYEEIDPLLTRFEDKLQSFVDVLNEAKSRDRNRGPLNIQRLYGAHDAWLAWDTQVFDLLRRDTNLTKQQVSVIRQMAALRPEDQVGFWKENFQPLLEQEDLLRKEIASVNAKKPGSAKN